MPEIDRGVAVAYCDAPGPLEADGQPTFVAVSPTPRDWPADRVRSFYREYNRHMVQDLMVHEALPGHVLQLAHARRFRDGTPVRAAFWSGALVEGWAVYAEELMVRHGYPGQGNPDALRMQQLKMQLRTIINTILDVQLHCGELTKAGAMALMTGRGFQKRARPRASGGARSSPPPSCPLITWDTPKSAIWWPGCARRGRSGPSGSCTTKCSGTDRPRSGTSARCCSAERNGAGASVPAPPPSPGTAAAPAAS